MRTAVFALFASMGIIAALALASFFGYEVNLSIEGPEGRSTSTVAGAGQEEGVQPGQRGPQLIQVPSGTFRGPSGQPTLRGPSAPPPEE